MSGFISEPSGGWIHSDKVISMQGATYTVRYIGCLEVKVSMKQLDFKTRSSVAKECISRVCEAAGLKSADKKRRIDKKVLKSIADEPIMLNAGTNVSLNISSTNLKLTALDSAMVIASHDMPLISFASGGDTETLDFVAYIAKDEYNLRACYVLECGGGQAKDVISTIGQAFELRYKQYNMKPGLALGQPSTSNGGDADKDYYNDLPGKVPPDVGPPPVPPLPVTVPPRTTLPTLPNVSSPNLIDLNSPTQLTQPPLPEMRANDYVNDIVGTRDVFDMQPFESQPLPAPATASTGTFRKMEQRHIDELKKEVWFHGQISRAEAEKRLVKDGDFLVRESPNTEGQYVLSGMQDRTRKHLLLIDPEGVVRTKDRMFQSVIHLISYHCTNSLPIISAESVLVLRTPVLRS